MIRIAMQQKAIKVSKDEKMVKENENWVKLVSIIKPFAPKFDREQRVFSFQEGQIEKIAEKCRKNCIEIEVDNTDYNAIINKRFERMASRQLVCPDCGANYEIEQDGNVYCEICEG